MDDLSLGLLLIGVLGLAAFFAAPYMITHRYPFDRKGWTTDAIRRLVQQTLGKLPESFFIRPLFTSMLVIRIGHFRR